MFVLPCVSGGVWQFRSRYRSLVVDSPNYDFGFLYKHWSCSNERRPTYQATGHWSIQTTFTLKHVSCSSLTIAPFIVFVGIFTLTPDCSWQYFMLFFSSWLLWQASFSLSVLFFVNVFCVFAFSLWCLAVLLWPFLPTLSLLSQHIRNSNQTLLIKPAKLKIIAMDASAQKTELITIEFGFVTLAGDCFG
jgi:hypothetical protein